jgi:hypothetical protein
MSGFLTPCPSCACHVRAAEKACPHCGASLTLVRADRRTTAALLLGLTATVALVADGCNAGSSDDALAQASSTVGSGPSGSNVGPTGQGGSSSDQAAGVGGNLGAQAVTGSGGWYSSVAVSSYATSPSAGTGGCFVGNCAVCEMSMCAASACGSEQLACKQDSECMATITCVGSCMKNDAPCWDACLAAHKAGAAAFAKLQKCAACIPGPCSLDCNNSCGG